MDPREHQTATQFLRAVGDIGRRPSDSFTRRDAFLFRGQGNAAWSLTPSAFRGVKPGIDVATQAHFEFDQLREFFRTADEHGLQIPDDSQALRATLAQKHPAPQLWPERTFWSVLALAQHYGVQTRILDWTRDARVAMYFAAEKAAWWLRDATGQKQRPAGARELAVWVLDLRDAWSAQKRGRHMPFVVTTAPGFTNRNLAAQRGCFTLLQPKVKGHVLDTRPLDEIYKTNGRLAAHTLPIEQAPELLWLLARDGVTAASIYPGFEGVVRAMNEAALQRPILKFPLRRRRQKPMPA